MWIQHKNFHLFQKVEYKYNNISSFYLTGEFCVEAATFFSGGEIRQPFCVVFLLINLYLFIFNINIRILSHPLNSHRRQKLIDLFFTHFFGMAFFMEENESLVPKNIGLLGAETVVLGANHFSNLIQQLWLFRSWWLECLIRHETYPFKRIVFSRIRSNGATVGNISN